MLKLSDVAVTLGGVDILHGISATLHRGELCALIGPSGAGKSTLIKVLLGLVEPDRGAARLDQGDVTSAGPIGYVPQDDALHRTLTVRQSLGFAARLRLPERPEEERAERVEAICRKLGLEEREDVRIKKLSGGQRKRVSVAMELLTEPPVLILDEPTSGLDPGLERRLMSLFSGVARSGRIVLVATHAMESLSRCDALMVLVGGHLAFHGPPAAALSWFRTDRYAGIFEQLPKMKPGAWQRRFLTSGERRAFEARSPVLHGAGPEAELEP